MRSCIHPLLCLYPMLFSVYAPKTRIPSKYIDFYVKPLGARLSEHKRSRASRSPSPCNCCTLWSSSGDWSLWLCLWLILINGTIQRLGRKKASMRLTTSKMDSQLRSNVFSRTRYLLTRIERRKKKIKSLIWDPKDGSPRKLSLSLESPRSCRSSYFDDAKNCVSSADKSSALPTERMQLRLDCPHYFITISFYCRPYSLLFSLIVFDCCSLSMMASPLSYPCYLIVVT